MTDVSQYQARWEALIQQPVYHIEQDAKSALLLPLLQDLHDLHGQACPAYKQITASSAHNHFTSLSDLPYIAVRLFKLLSLSSIKEQEVFRVLQSSGTTSQVPAKVVLDKATSARQSKTLVMILQEFIGKARLPMLIIDSPAVVKSASLSARGAGIQGVAFFGRDHTYALNEDMTLNTEALQQFHVKYADKPVLVFGFTFMVWLHFIQSLAKQTQPLHFKHGVLIHSGGWKKLIDQQVDNPTFKAKVTEVTGIKRIHNFYGMAEQVGSIFMECEKGMLHTPVMADVIIRNPYTLAESPLGETGLIQVISALPTSYPGQSILTEDMGVLEGVDDCTCGRKGRYFTVQGRLPKTELRGCSDTGSLS